MTALLAHPLARVLAALCAVFGIALAPARAQTAAPAVDENALKAFVSQQVAANLGDTVSRFEVRLGQVDPNAQLAPCRRVEPFLPSNARLWGRGSVGVRCADGANWTLMVPVTVVAWGNALVAAGPMSTGAVVTEQDIREQEIELTREPAGSLPREPAKLVGRTLARSLQAGQAFRNDMTRVTAVVQAGDPVRLRLSGRGYAVTASAQALAAAGEGQTVRVRTELGKILTGVAREGRVVEVAL
jgi:flagellar basal body P-ring formation protein FlgA